MSKPYTVTYLSDLRVLGLLFKATAADETMTLSELTKALPHARAVVHTALVRLGREGMLTPDRLDWSEGTYWGDPEPVSLTATGQHFFENTMSDLNSFMLDCLGVQDDTEIN